MGDENASVRGIVLAGGEGKRLRPLSYYFQKCMIPIGSKQKPLLEYILHLLRNHGILDIALLVGYKHEQIVNYFNSGERFGVKITYVPDDPTLKGTGGSLLNALRRKVIHPHETLLVYYGDIVSAINITEMVERHRQRGAVATIALSSVWLS
jgi:mannose-1-phosphate guanylyltransferase